MTKAIAVLQVKEHELGQCRKTVCSILNKNPEINVLLCIQTETEGFTVPEAIKEMNRVSTHLMAPTDDPLAALVYGMDEYPSLPIISVKSGINYDSNCLEELYRMHEKFPRSICTAAFNMVKVSRNDDKPVATFSSLAEKRKDTNLANKYYEIVCPQDTLYPPSDSTMFTCMHEFDFDKVPMNEDTAYIFMAIVCADYDISIRHLSPALELPEPQNKEAIIEAVREYYDQLFPPISHALPLKKDGDPDEEMEVYVVSSTKNRVARIIENDPCRKFFFVDEEHDEPNIDRFNPWFCELTALYYLHKHSTAKYVGLEHYRRCFVMQDNGSYDVNSSYNILPKSDAIEILEKYDAIVAFHQHTKGRSAYSFLEVSHYTKMFNAWLDIVEEGTPGFKQFCLDRLHHDMLICCNMFIAKKELIDKYCEWLFPNTRKFMKKYPVSEKKYRHIGYLGEFTFGSWLLFNKYKLKLQPHIRFNKDLSDLEETERTVICMEEL